MNYFKILNDGYIVAVGYGEVEGSEPSSVFEYTRCQNLLANMPKKAGYRYKLGRDLQWEEIKVPEDELSEAEIRDMYSEEIKDSIIVETKPTAEKEGFKLVQKYDPMTHTIRWEYVEIPKEEEENGPTGTYIDPFRYETGMAVTTGLWYTDGDNIWEAIADGVPSGFDDAEYFDIIA